MTEPRSKQPLLLISNLETLKVMTDPLHLQILELLNPEPQTVNQIAQQLGTSGSRLYYHVNMMESVGLIRVVETRTINNIIEKIYWVTAEQIEIDRDLLNFSSPDGQENVSRLIVSALDATREDLLRSLRARSDALAHGAPPHPRQVVLKKFKKRIRDEVYDQFVEEFNLLIQKIEDLPDAATEAPDVNVYSVACFLYPSFAFNEELNQLTTEDFDA